MSGRRSGGFTLIEVGVVLALVVFLVAGIGAACAGLRQGSREESTRALVRALDAGCDSYRTKLGAFPGSPRASTDTTILHRTLCVPFAATEGNAGAAGRTRLAGPFVELPSSRTSCAPQIHDDWGWPVRYSLPGTHHGPGGDNSSRFDIDASSTEGGVIGNWR